MLKETIYSQTEHEFARYAADYELYQLGSYDDNSGKIESYPPSHILNLNTLKWAPDTPNGGADEEKTAALDSQAEIATLVQANGLNPT